MDCFHPRTLSSGSSYELSTSGSGRSPKLHVQGWIVSLTCHSKVESPMYDVYWERRADARAFYAREYRVDLGEFNKSRSRPDRNQRRVWPGSIFMEDNDGNKIMVPRVSRLALQQIKYVDFVKGVLQANRPKSISLFTM